MDMDIAPWWSQLSADDRRHLIENNGDAVPTPLRARLVDAGAIDGSSAWWIIDEEDPSHVELSDDVTDWIEAVANGEKPAHQP